MPTRYSDLSQKELSELTIEQIQNFIDLENAYAGIFPLLRPIAPAPLDIQLKTTVTVYNIAGILVKSPTLVQDIFDFIQGKVFEEQYDYQRGGYNYKWVEVKEIQIIPCKYYDKEDIDQYGGRLRDHKVATEKYDAEKRKYDKYQKQTEDNNTEVWDAVNNAKEYFKKFNKVTEDFKKFLVLAEGNEDIALNFLRNAYNNASQSEEKYFIDALEEITGGVYVS